MRLLLRALIVEETLDSINNFNSKDALKIIDHILHKHEQLELYKIRIEEAQ